MPLVFPYLDTLFPGSKFILTTRDEESWLRSVQWLFEQGRIIYNWEADGTSSSIHYALYGTTKFSAERCVKMFRTYHREVEEYFADRPKDLLRINFREGDGWKKLCNFLEVDEPEDSFPRRNRQFKPNLKQRIAHYRSVLKAPRNRLRSQDPEHMVRALDPRIAYRDWMHRAPGKARRSS